MQCSGGGDDSRAHQRHDEGQDDEEVGQSCIPDPSTN